MPWALLAVGIAGLVLGLRFRVPTLFVATVLTAVLSIVVNLYLGSSVQAMLVAVIAALVVLQTAYLLGLLLAFAWSRLRSRQPG